MAEDIILPPIRPSAGCRDVYQQKLENYLDCMHRSFMKWILAAYRANEPIMNDLAEDAVPANVMQKAMRELKRQWLKQINEGAAPMAKKFAKTTGKQTDVQLKQFLKKRGISVEFTMTKAQRDVMRAVVHENVSLIKSIPQEYMKGVEGAVMRSVQTGRDVGALAKELEDQYDMSRRRARTIARDQNNKATGAFNRVRQLELGVEEAIWQHSYAGKQPRLTHVRAGESKARYKVSQGWYDPAVQRYIQPGELINCRCTSRSVIPGFV